MNCGGNDGNGGRDKDGKTPEQRHRENVQKMDYWKRREEEAKRRQREAYSRLLRIQQERKERQEEANKKK